MWYTTGHETPYFYPTFHPRRAAPDPIWLAFVRCLCLASQPDSAGFGAWRTRSRHRAPPRLRRPDGAQCDPRVQYDGPDGLPGRLLPPAPRAHHLQRGTSKADPSPVASQSPRLWQSERFVDLGPGGPGQFRARTHQHDCVRREYPPPDQALRPQLEARQTLDHQPRPAVSGKKNARDRLIAWASQQPSWAIGFGDEVWWSRFALPQAHARPRQDQPVRLVEQAWRKDDPDRKRAGLLRGPVAARHAPSSRPLRDPGCGS